MRHHGAASDGRGMPEAQRTAEAWQRHTVIYTIMRTVSHLLSSLTKLLLFRRAPSHYVGQPDGQTAVKPVGQSPEKKPVFFAFHGVVRKGEVVGVQ